MAARKAAQVVRGTLCARVRRSAPTLPFVVLLLDVPAQQGLRVLRAQRRAAQVWESRPIPLDIRFFLEKKGPGEVIHGDRAEPVVEREAREGHAHGHMLAGACRDDPELHVGQGSEFEKPGELCDVHIPAAHRPDQSGLGHHRPDRQVAGRHPLLPDRVAAAVYERFHDGEV